ncbi:hypothetical protein JCM10449v2_004776 [Rhodotorula kratochvilovae]
MSTTHSHEHHTSSTGQQGVVGRTEEKVKSAAESAAAAVPVMQAHEQRKAEQGAEFKATGADTSTGTGTTTTESATGTGKPAQVGGLGTGETAQGGEHHHTDTRAGVETTKDPRASGLVGAAADEPAIQREGQLVGQTGTQDPPALGKA